MAKPLGYYTSNTPPNEGVLAELQDAFGAQLQNLNKAQKLVLIAIIAGDLACQYSMTDQPYGNQVFNYVSKIRELPLSDREGLIECLINGVRYQ